MLDREGLLSVENIEDLKNTLKEARNKVVIHSKTKGNIDTTTALIQVSIYGEVGVSC